MHSHEFFFSYDCTCPDNGPNYDVNCQPIPPCLSNPCEGNATCVDYVQNNTFQCKCSYEYEGLLCENQTNRCDLLDVQCENGGTCLETEDGMSYDNAVSNKIDDRILNYLFCYLCIKDTKLKTHPEHALILSLLRIFVLVCTVSTV